MRRVKHRLKSWSIQPKEMVPGSEPRFLEEQEYDSGPLNLLQDPRGQRIDRNWNRRAV